MMEMTGMSMFETDGPYPGYQCASTEHKYHKNQGVCLLFFFFDINYIGFCLFPDSLSI